MTDKTEVNLSGVKQSKGVWLVKVCPPADYYISTLMDEISEAITQLFHMLPCLSANTW